MEAPQLFLHHSSLKRDKKARLGYKRSQSGWVLIGDKVRSSATVTLSRAAAPLRRRSQLRFQVTPGCLLKQLRRQRERLRSTAKKTQISPKAEVFKPCCSPVERESTEEQRFTPRGDDYDRTKAGLVLHGYVVRKITAIDQDLGNPRPIAYQIISVVPKSAHILCFSLTMLWLVFPSTYEAEGLR
ncbi:hypothetical protein WMY93_018608 [Mugilogobius chulae]|uniref:Uncharacterized protein n=1 Tax=Mugilogobius chulae TaxID=88201 RepID=A0AAW0NWM5_9GOBI